MQSATWVFSKNQRVDPVPQIYIYVQGSFTVKDEKNEQKVMHEEKKKMSWQKRLLLKFAWGRRVQNTETDLTIRD